jgi:hypothetical protein
LQAQETPYSLPVVPLEILKALVWLTDLFLTTKRKTRFARTKARRKKEGGPFVQNKKRHPGIGHLTMKRSYHYALAPLLYSTQAQY